MTLKPNTVDWLENHYTYERNKTKSERFKMSTNINWVYLLKSYV